MSTVLHVKLDEDLKKEAQAAAKDIGLPLSTIVSANLKEFVRSRSVTISDTPVIKPELEQELLDLAKKSLEERTDLSPAFSTTEEAKKWIESV